MTEPPLTVLYNADCPICRAEIEHYAAYAAPRGLAIGFEPLDRADLASWNLTTAAAAKRLHVRLPDGAILSGVPAFRALWMEMPRYRLLARAVGLPGLRQLAALVYNRVLAPALYRAHLRRQARGGLNPAGSAR
jgi:predicted DCC family thiol-disulfide oxidoreductase YuxK